MNILILSVGTRNKIVQYFKENLVKYQGKVIATDASNLAPALYEADKYYIVPKIHEENYLEEILKICKNENIHAVLSLIDPELNLLANNAELFKEMNITIIGSGKEQCDISLDKMKFYRWLTERGYLTAKTYDNLETFLTDYHENCIDFPVFVKPKNGSASTAINKVYDMETLTFLINQKEDMIIQEFMGGQEIGVDVYIDMLSGEIVSAFMKEKILMRAGETDKSVSFIDSQLFEYLEKFVNEMGYRGQIDIDVFRIDGEYYISEVNPRFGGGYPHAYECGVNHMKYIIQNIAGNQNTPHLFKYPENMFMMKYNEVKVVNPYEK